MTNKQIISFNKRFANGEQDIQFSNATHKIVKTEKLYYWQENAIYNKILPIVEAFKKRTEVQDENVIYGKNGLVDLLVPLQREYNAIKNRRTEYLNRAIIGVVFVEDGSVDVDNLEEDGVAPGKIIIYRQGSDVPTLEASNLKDLNVFTELLHSVEKEMQGIFNSFVVRYGEANC